MISVLLISIVMLPVSVLLDLSLVTTVTLSFLAAVILFSVYPFVLKLSNEEEPYW